MPSGGSEGSTRCSSARLRRTFAGLGCGSSPRSQTSGRRRAAEPGSAAVRLASNGRPTWKRNSALFFQKFGRKKRSWRSESRVTSWSRAPPAAMVKLPSRRWRNATPGPQTAHAVTAGAGVVCATVPGGEREVAALDPFDVGAQLALQTAPEAVRLHHQRHLERIAPLLADEAPVLSRLLAGRGPALQDDDTRATTGEEVRGGAADDAGPHDDDVRVTLHDRRPSSAKGRHVSTRPGNAARRAVT